MWLQLVWDDVDGAALRSVPLAAAQDELGSDYDDIHGKAMEQQMQIVRTDWHSCSPPPHCVLVSRLGHVLQQLADLPQPLRCSGFAQFSQLESIADADDDFAELFLLASEEEDGPRVAMDGEDAEAGADNVIPLATVKAALRRVVLQSSEQYIPLFCGSAYKNKVGAGWRGIGAIQIGCVRSGARPQSPGSVSGNSKPA